MEDKRQRQQMEVGNKEIRKRKEKEKKENRHGNVLDEYHSRCKGNKDQREFEISRGRPSIIREHQKASYIQCTDE